MEAQIIKHISMNSRYRKFAVLLGIALFLGAACEAGVVNKEPATTQMSVSAPIKPTTYPSFAPASIFAAESIARQQCSKPEFASIYEVVQSKIEQFAFLCMDSILHLSYDLSGTLEGIPATTAAPQDLDAIPIPRWKISADEATATATKEERTVSSANDLQLWSRTLSNNVNTAYRQDRPFEWAVSFVNTDFTKNVYVYIDAETGAVLGNANR
jgi:hypothetical protein